MENITDNKEKSERHKLALVLGSGSVKCVAALGLWEVFYQEGIPIDMVVGCSGGSVLAAPIAYGMEPSVIKESILKMWNKDTFKINYLNFPKILFPRLLGFDAYFGMYKDTNIVKALESFWGDLHIEDARIPLYIVATDLLAGERVVLSEGKVTDAIRASISLPLILGPKEINGRLLVDGGASDPLPISVAIKESAGIIIALGYESPYHEGLGSLAAIAQQLSSISINNLLTANLSFYNLAHYHEIVLIVPDFGVKIGAFDTDKIPYIIEVGKRATEEKVAYIKSLLFAPDNSEI